VANRFVLEPEEIVPFHCLHPKGRPLVRISFDKHHRWSWSGAFPLHDVGEYYLRLVKTEKPKECFVRVEIKLELVGK